MNESCAVPRTDPPSFYDWHVFVCCNRRPDDHRRGSCAARGSEKLKDYMKARMKELGVRSARVNSAGCMERCEFGPAIVIYPDAVWYRPQSTADIDEIIAVHIQNGGRVQRLMLTEHDVPPRDG